LRINGSGQPRIWSRSEGSIACLEANVGKRRVVSRHFLVGELRRDLANELTHRQIMHAADQRSPLVEVRAERLPDGKDCIHDEKPI
jgi:hypothetical protein